MSARVEASAWDSTPTRSVLPGLLVTVALLALVPAVVSTLLRLFPPTEDSAALVASFIPYGLLGYAVALLCLLLALVRARRRRLIAALAVLVVALASGHVVWMAPLFVPDHRASLGPSFTLLTQNVYKGEADVDALTALAEGAGSGPAADVVVLEETTPDFLRALESSRWRSRYAYSVGSLDGPASDTTVFSRFPLSGAEPLGRTSFQQWVMTVEVPGRSPVRLIAAHPCNPFCGNGLFASDHALLRSTVRANQIYPLVVAGDLNATDDHVPLQQLRRDGMRSATDLVGAGWLPTYPANRGFPPLIPIDHVLVDDAMNATALQTVRVPGTDHLGLLVTLVGSLAVG